MWKRFTDRSRKTVFNALEAAQHAGASGVNPNHLLLALLKMEGSSGLTALERLGVDRQVLLKSLASQKEAPTGDQDPDMTLTPEAKGVLDAAVDEAQLAGSLFIGTEHLLIGIFREGQSKAALELRQNGATLESLRKVVAEIAAEGKAGNLHDEHASASGRGRQVPAAKFGGDLLSLDAAAEDILSKARSMARVQGSSTCTSLLIFLNLLESGLPFIEDLFTDKVEEIVNAVLHAHQPTRGIYLYSLSLDAIAALSVAHDLAHQAELTTVTPECLLAALLRSPSQEVASALAGAKLDVKQAAEQAWRLAKTSG